MCEFTVKGNTEEMNQMYIINDNNDMLEVLCLMKDYCEKKEDCIGENKDTIKE